jgi:hypothetical protein
MFIGALYQLVPGEAWIVAPAHTRPEIVRASVDTVVPVDTVATVLTAPLLERWLAIAAALKALPAADIGNVPVDSLLVEIPGIGQTRHPTLDFSAVVGKKPAVAAVFARFGWTPQQYNAVTRKFIGALISSKLRVRQPGGTAQDTSRVGRNAAFASTHQAEIGGVVTWGLTRARPSDNADKKGLVGVAAPPLKVAMWLNAPASTPAPTFGDGNVYLLGFTAIWCEGCPLTYGPLASLAQRYANKGVRVMMVTGQYGHTVAALKAHFVDQHHIALAIALETNEATPTSFDESLTANAQQFGVSTLPDVVLVDRRGMIADRWSGGSTDSAGYTNRIANAVDSLLAKR